jgi:hypothetical protein
VAKEVEDRCVDVRLRKLNYGSHAVSKTKSILDGTPYPALRMKIDNREIVCFEASFAVPD